MSMPMYRLPEFTTPNALINWKPLGDGIDAITKAMKDRQQREALEKLAADPSLGLPPGMQQIAGAMEPAAGMNALLSGAQKRYGSELEVSQRERLMPMEYDQKKRLLEMQIPLETQAAMQRGRAASGEQMSREQAMIKWREQNDPLYRAQVGQASQKDEMGGIIADIMRRSIQGGGQPGVGGPAGQSQLPPGPAGGMMPGGPIRPQSMDGGGADPNIQLTQAPAGPAGQVGQPTPTQAPAGPPPNEPMVSTPFGLMPQTQARALGGAFAYSGKGELGKMFNEAVRADDFGKHTKDKIEEKAFNTTEAMGRLKGIGQSFDPKFLTIENKAKQYGVSWLDSFETTRGKIPADAAKDFERFTVFKQDTLGNLNQHIKEMTGAAMSEQEAKRLMAAMPNMEDSPRQFQAKLGRVSEQSQLAMARLSYLRKNGFAGPVTEAETKLPLDRMQKMIDERAGQLNRELQSVPDAQRRQMMRQKLREEFGIGA